MPTVNMTTRWLETLRPPETGRIEYHDEKLTGLVLRVTMNHARTWCAVYRVAGRTAKRRYTIGPYPAIDLAEARRRAAEALSAAAHGKDTASTKRTVRHSPTFGILVEEYLQRHASTKKSGHKDRSMLDNDVLPAWRHWKAQDVKQRDVIEVLDKIVDRGAPIQANRTFQVIRKVFNFGIQRGLVESNPCNQVKAPARENQRSRVLSDAEIKTFWEKLDVADMAPATARALRLILVTAQRPGEVATMARSEMIGEWWTIPGNKAKNGLPHRVPLSGLALEQIIADAKKGDAKVPGRGEIVAPGASEAAESFVFPSPRGDGPIEPHALATAINRAREHFGEEIAHFTPHDLRRTAASRMTAMGISRLVVMKILNHKETGVTAVYDRYSYDREKIEALSRWACELRAILADESGKVVELRKAS